MPELPEVQAHAEPEYPRVEQKQGRGVARQPAQRPDAKHEPHGGEDEEDEAQQGVQQPGGEAPEEAGADQAHLAALA